MPGDNKENEEPGKEREESLSLPDKLSELFRDVPEDRQEELLGILGLVERQISITSSSGPIPSPEMLERYKQIQSDYPERILKMAEKEQKGRIESLERVDHIEIRKVNGAIFLGFGVLVVAGIATIMGQIAIAIPLGIIGIVGSVIQSFFQKPSSSGSNGNSSKNTPATQ